MTRIRVLVVDDSVVIRKIVSDLLAEDPDIEVDRHRRQRSCGRPEDRAAQARPGDHGHRDAGDERHRGGPRAPRAGHADADHHVQHAHRAGRRRHPRRACRRCLRLRPEARQRRQRRQVDGAGARGADPADQVPRAAPWLRPRCRSDRSPGRAGRAAEAPRARPPPDHRPPAPGDRQLDRRPRGAGLAVRQPAVAGRAGRRRPAHAAAVHPAVRRAARPPVRRSRSSRPRTARTCAPAGLHRSR